jgi:excisionase family DNA binding protein
MRAVASPPSPERLALANRVMRLASKGWVSMHEFAQLIGVSYPTIMRMRESGNFSYIRVGEQYRVYLEEVERFLREGNLPTEEPEPESIDLQEL